MAIRNIKTAFPFATSLKENKYHGVVGHASENSWRKTRDEYLVAFESWKNVITTWKSYDYYHIAMYLPYEYLLDPVQGPATVQKFAKQLKLAGFPVVAMEEESSSSLQCIWYHSVKDSVEFIKEVYRIIINRLPEYLKDDFGNLNRISINERNFNTILVDLEELINDLNYIGEYSWIIIIIRNHLIIKR